MSQTTALSTIVEKIDRAIEFVDPVSGFSSLRDFEHLLISNQNDGLYDSNRKLFDRMVQSLLGKMHKIK